MSKVILYIATSQDGFIADHKGDVNWLPQPESPEDLETVGYNQLMERIGTIIMGSRSYDQILGFGEWAWNDKHTYVVTSKSGSSDLPHLEFTNDTPSDLIKKIENNNGNKDIWLLGGAELAQSFAKDHLIDEIILTIIPVTLGQGKPLGLSFEDFTLDSEKPCMDGIIQKTFSRKTVLLTS